MTVFATSMPLTDVPSGPARNVWICEHLAGHMQFTTMEQAAAAWPLLYVLSSRVFPGVAPKLRADIAALAADVAAYLHGTGLASKIQSQIQLGAGTVRADCARYGVTI